MGAVSITLQESGVGRRYIWFTDDTDLVKKKIVNILNVEYL